MSLEAVNNRVVQRTSSNTGKLRTESERAAFSLNVRQDLANIVSVINELYYPMFQTLHSDADEGLHGRTVYTDVLAEAASNPVFWDSGNSQPKTLKESFDTVLSEIARLDNELAALLEEEIRDTEALEAVDTIHTNNITQIAIDSFGENYTLDENGLANLDYSLSQLIDSIGALFTSYPGSGNTYGSPLTVTLPQASVTSLATHLSAIRSYTGMATAVETLPSYTTYGTVAYVNNTQPLVQAIQTLDAALASASPILTNNKVLLGNGTSNPVTDTELSYDSINNYLGIGTASPECALDARGKVQHTGGVISRGGDARGSNANDLQANRSVNTQVASGAHSTILGGQDNTASGAHSSVVGGQANVSSGSHATTAGRGNTASGSMTVATGYESSASLYGQRAHAVGKFSTLGDCQEETFLARATTTNATPTEVYLDGSSERLTLPDNCSVSVVAYVLGRSSTGDTGHYKFEFTAKRAVGAGTTALVGASTKTVIAEDNAAWDCLVEPDSFNGNIGMLVTGVAATNIHWIIRLQILKLVY